MTSQRQLALNFSQAQIFARAAFLPGAANEAAREWLAAPRSWPGLRLAIFGESGTGKTHLLHAFTARHAAALLPGSALRHWMDLPDAPAIAVDDADTAPDPECLLHLLNSAAEQRVPVLLAGQTPPARWHPALADLSSRLRAIHAVALHPPEDSLLRALLAQLVAERQLIVPVAIQDFLTERLPRTGAALREAAALLDRLSLAAGRRVTRSMAQAVLVEMGRDVSENITPALSPGERNLL